MEGDLELDLLGYALEELGPPWIALRPDDPGVEEEDLLLRFRCDDRNQLVKVALADWSDYGPILQQLGRPGRGAFALSVFAVRDRWTAEALESGDLRRRPWACVSASALRACHVEVELLPTVVFTVDGELDPRQEVHYDAVVDVPEELATHPDLVTGTRSERQAARESVLAIVGPVIDLWFPSS